MQHWVRTVIEELTWANHNLSEQTRKSINRIINLIENDHVYHFQSEEMASIADSVSECDNLSELSELIWKAATSVGFQNFAIFVIRQGRGASYDPRICTSYNENWVKRYVQRSYQYVDPVILKASESDGCFEFAKLRHSSPAIEEFWSDADGHRVGRSGFCIAMTRSDGTRIGVSFSTQDTDENVSKIIRQHGSDLCFLAQLASDAFSFIASGPPLNDDILNIAELRFLYILSKSKNPNDALKISSCFGSNEALQVMIKKKLGVETVFQAVAIAAAKGWFDCLPYNIDEIVTTFSPLQGISLFDDASSAVKEFAEPVILND